MKQKQKSIKITRHDRKNLVDEKISYKSYLPTLADHIAYKFFNKINGYLEELSSQIDEVNNEFDELKMEVKVLISTSDNMEQNINNFNLRFYGIPGSKSQNNSGLRLKMQKIFERKKGITDIHVEQCYSSVRFDEHHIVVVVFVCMPTRNIIY